MSTSGSVKAISTRWQNRVASSLAATALITLVVGSSGVVARAAGKPESASTPQAPEGKPAGYSIQEATFTTIAGTDNNLDSVACPVTAQGVQTMPTGGGAVVSASSIDININSSYPYGKSWIVNINNAITSNAVAHVYAVCTVPRKGYIQMETGTIAAAPNSEIAGTINCPKGTHPSGGGVSSQDIDLNQNVAESGPSANGWLGAISNFSVNQNDFNVWAVCESFSKRWAAVEGPTTQIPQAAPTYVQPAVCPTGDYVLGGGVLYAYEPGELIGSVWPESTGEWEGIENNQEGAFSDNSWAICT
jgi:hypothetical protein